jgi:plastocyanin
VKKVPGGRRRVAANFLKAPGLFLQRRGNTRVALGLILLLSIAGAAAKVIYFNGRIAEVKLGDNGFEPARIKINLGDKVVWRVEGRNRHWPAADTHPSHNLYPESGGCLGSKLDACRAMEAGETFSFRFDKPGRWGMHDHLHPANGMIVEVEGGRTGFGSWFAGLVSRFGSVEPKAAKVGRSEKFSTGQINTLNEIGSAIDPKDAAAKASQICRQWQFGKFADPKQCYAEVFYELTKTAGSATAFEAIAELQKTDKSIGSCHTIVHGIGWAVYDQDPEKWREGIGGMSAECGYAGIHGVLERYTSDGGTFTGETVPTTCGSNPNRACIHGLGHVLLIQSKNNLDDALKLCGSFPVGPARQRHDCMAGVFMERMVASNLYEHGYVSRERAQKWKDYLADDEKLCRQQNGDRASACWEMLVRPAAEVYKNQPVEVLQLCVSAANSDLIKLCSRASAQVVTISKRFDLDAVRPICSYKIEVYPEFEGVCYSSIARAGVVNTTAEVLNRVVRFCGGLAESYKEGCFKTVKQSLPRSQANMTEVQSACGLIPLKYKSGCGVAGEKY